MGKYEIMSQATTIAAESVQGQIHKFARVEQSNGKGRGGKSEIGQNQVSWGFGGPPWSSKAYLWWTIERLTTPTKIVTDKIGLRVAGKS